MSIPEHEKKSNICCNNICCCCNVSKVIFQFSYSILPLGKNWSGVLVWSQLCGIFLACKNAFQDFILKYKEAKVHFDQLRERSHSGSTSIDTNSNSVVML